MNSVFDELGLVGKLKNNLKNLTSRNTKKQLIQKNELHKTM
jgi:hypothetical protein